MDPFYADLNNPESFRTFLMQFFSHLQEQVLKGVRTVEKQARLNQALNLLCQFSERLVERDGFWDYWITGWDRVGLTKLRFLRDLLNKEQEQFKEREDFKRLQEFVTKLVVAEEGLRDDEEDYEYSDSDPDLDENMSFDGERHLLPGKSQLIPLGSGLLRSA